MWGILSFRIILIGTEWLPTEISSLNGIAGFTGWKALVWVLWAISDSNRTGNGSCHRWLVLTLARGWMSPRVTLELVPCAHQTALVGPLTYPAAAVLCLQRWPRSSSSPERTRYPSAICSHSGTCCTVTAGATLGSAKIAGSWPVRSSCDLPRG